MIAEKYKDRYYLNGESVFRRWGIVIEEGGYSEMTKKSSRKDQYVYDWQDENGVERYVGNKLIYEANQMTFKCSFIANSHEEYLTNMNDFYRELDKGYFKLYSSHLGLTNTLLYNSVSSIEESEGIWKHTIVFDNDNSIGDYKIIPLGLFDTNSFLTDEQLKILTTRK